MGKGACREFKEIKEIKEIKEVGVGDYFSLSSLNSLNSLISLISLYSLNPLNSQSFSPLTIPVKKWWLLCIVKQNDKPKNTTTMKLNYTIDCRHCGNHSQFEFYTNSQTMRHQDINSVMHIDTECAMRCPVCRYRLNTTEADFRSQVHVSREA